jgi:hypothetical protein
MPRILIGVGVTLYLGAYAYLFLTDEVRPSHLLADVVTGYFLAWAMYGLLSTISQIEVVRRFLLTTVSIVAGLLIVEAPAMMRIVDYRDFVGSIESKAPLSIAGRHADAELLWQHDPYYEYEEAYEGNISRALCIPPDPMRKLSVRYDRNGFRNSEDLERADIVVIGDSYIESYMTPESQLMTTILGQLTGTVVANLGHSGYGPRQELSVLKRYGLLLRPSTVIWAFFEGNDFSETDQYEGQVAMLGHPVLQDIWFRSITRNILATTLYPVRKCVPHSEIQDFQATFISHDQRAIPTFFSPFEIHPQALSDSKLNTVLTIIADAAMLCREHNINFIVAFVPDKYRVYHDLPTVRLAPKSLHVRTVNDLPNELGTRLAQLNLGIRYVDLTPSLKTVSAKGIAAYLPDDTHWAEAGNQIVAEMLQQALHAPKSQTPLGSK